MDFYLPTKQINSVSQTKSASSSMEDATQSVQNVQISSDNQNKELASQAFQAHLDKGYQGMLETLKQLPPQIASTLPDPGAYSDSEDKRVAWYAAANDAIAKNGLLDQAQSSSANPDALATAAARAPLSSASQQQVSGEIGRLDQNQQKSAIQKAAGMFSDTPAPSDTPKMAMPTDISPKTGFGRTLKIALTNMEPHADTIQNAATKAGIPPQLIMAVATQESGGNSGATSKTGVKGTMQVTNGTFKDVANRHPDLNLTDRNDPAQSYTAGATYLGELVQQFGGNIDQALAAYNGGPSAVKAAVAQYPNDWKSHLDEFMTPDKASEASDYVDQVGKYFKALGGSNSPAVPKAAPTQTQFNQALLKSNPDAVVNPIAKEIQSGLKSDAQIAATNTKNSTTAEMSQSRLDLAKQRLKNTLDYQGYQKVDKYGTAIKDVAPAALAIKRIDNIVGGLDGTGDIPGVGVGAGLFKNFLMTSATPQARDLRLALADLFPQISHAQFGSRLTSTEVGLLGQQLGTSWLADSDTFRKAMKQQREDVWQRLNDKWAALPDDAKKELYDQGVANPDMFGDFKSNIVNPGAGKNAVSTGGHKLSAAAQAIIDKVKAERLAKAGK